MKRSHRLEKMAAVYDEEILPVWTERFGRMILRDLVLPPRAVVLNVACATGYPALDILQRIEDGRVICIDPIAPLVDRARQKAGTLAMRRVFFRTESADGRLAFADEVYDLVVSNLGLPDLKDPAASIKEFVRVLKRGGQLMLTTPLRGSFAEFFDVYREVLVKHDRADALARLDQHVAATPDAATLIGWAGEAGLDDADVETDEFTLLFGSSREFFFAPVIEYGPLPAWKALSGRGEEMQQIFWHIKEAIDAYFTGRAFQLTVKAGCLRARRPIDTTTETVIEVGDEDLTVLDSGDAEAAPRASRAGGRDPSEGA